MQTLARPLLAGIFVAGGLNSARQPESKVPPVEKLAKKALGERANSLPPLPTLIRADGIVKAVAGSAMAVGVAPRLSALVLSGSLVPTTLAAHDFWDLKDPAARAQQQIQFLKNAGLLGGLLLVAFPGKHQRRR